MTHTLHQGRSPLLISLPHDGSELPPELAERLTASACRAPDTDWFVSRLYAFARELDATLLVPRFSRYVVDLNRPPDDVSLYPGQNTTGLCPIVQFSGEPVYLQGQQPSLDEIHWRVEHYWRPYHKSLQAEIARLRGAHGRMVLWEGHSIRSQLPFLFNGRLPDLNLGTANGASCSAGTQSRLEAVLAAQDDYSWVCNGRFKGGYITRQYGVPARDIDAVQLELAQGTYMDEDTGAYDEAAAARLQVLLRSLLQAALG